MFEAFFLINICFSLAAFTTDSSMLEVFSHKLSQFILICHWLQNEPASMQFELRSLEAPTAKVKSFDASAEVLEHPFSELLLGVAFIVLPFGVIELRSIYLESYTA